MKSLLLITLLGITFSTLGNINSSFEKLQKKTPTTVKERAFKILQTKCNVCHEKKNKRRVFTLDNMDKNKRRINWQVFRFKRMPKGDDIKLTKEEYSYLKEWILETKK